MMEPGQLVNKIGKALNRYIDGAYKIKFSENKCDVYIRMYYQVPGDPSTFREMKFDINICTYQKKIRVNVIEETAAEKTVGHSVFKPEELKNTDEAPRIIYDKIKHQIEREYADYDFVY